MTVRNHDPVTHACLVNQLGSVMKAPALPRSLRVRHRKIARAWVEQIDDTLRQLDLVLSGADAVELSGILAQKAWWEERRRWWEARMR